MIIAWVFLLGMEIIMEIMLCFIGQMKQHKIRYNVQKIHKAKKKNIFLNSNKKLELRETQKRDTA